ncbi:MAG: hypothetical protein ABJC09_14135 [Terriglobia bacterium]
MASGVSQVRPMYDAVRWTVFSVLVFAAIEGIVFRSGWYFKYLAPQSSAGQVELRHYWITHSRPTAEPEVLVLGDSRIAEGFSARVASAEVGGRIHFWNAGVGGSSPRVWYYLLRDSDSARNRFAAVVLPLDHYSDRDNPDRGDKRITDLNYAIGRLRVTDCYTFARSFHTPGLLLHAMAGCLFKGMILRDDVNDLLSDYHERIKAAHLWRTDGLGFVDGYDGRAEDVGGISVDWATRHVKFPPGLTDAQRSTIESTVTPPPVPQTGELNRYRQFWFGKLLSLYAKSDTRIIFIEIPRAPLPTPESSVPAAFIDSVRGRRDVAIVPRETFRELERPDLLFGESQNDVSPGALC